MASLWDTVAGTADHLAGSTDEAIGRQFDDEEGGGFADVGDYQIVEGFGTADPTAVLDPDREFGFDLFNFGDPDSSVFPEQSRELSESFREDVGLNEENSLLIQGVVVAIVLGAALWLLRPLLEVVAAVAED